MSGIDFQAVNDKKISPSYNPALKDDKDVSNFDQKFTKERLELVNYNAEGFSFYGTNDNLKLNDTEYLLNFSSSKLVTSQSTIYHMDEDFLLEKENSRSDEN